MTLQQIQYFITVCKYKNFTKAAEELNISQPGISFAMKDLENECGVALFHRQKNNISITSLAILMNVDRNTVSQYEKGERLPSLEYYYKFCVRFNLSMFQLLK